MSNFINTSVVAAEALDQLDYELVAGKLVYRDRTSDFATVRGLKVGDAVTIRTVTDLRTDEFTGTAGTQEVQQSSTQLIVEKHFNTPVEITAKEKALNLDGIRKEIVNPAMISMAQKIDTFLLSKITQSQGLYASAGPLADAADIALARKAANLQQISKSNRIGLVNDDLEAILLAEDVFHKFDTRGQPAVNALMEADMGRLMGINWFSSVNMPDVARTPGTATATLDNALDASNLQGLNVLTIDNGTAAPFNAGDKIQIAGAKRAFTVTSTIPDASAVSTITVDEQINELLNQTSLDDAVITVIDSGSASTDYQGIIFNPGAYAFATPPLDPVTSEDSSVASADGMSIRVTESYDRTTKKTFWDFDMLIGGKAVDSRLSMLIGKTS